MSEQFKTADLALPYHTIPRIDERFMLQEDSYVDILLPSMGNEPSRLRLHDIHERWIRAIDLSAYIGYLPEADDMTDAPYGAFDDFELGEEFFIGRDHNPNHLPVLDKKTVSRSHLGITLSIGECGLILALKDLGSHNGTEIVRNNTLQPFDAAEPVLV